MAVGDPTGWFDRLYQAGTTGEVKMPWDRTAPHWTLEQWATSRRLNGAGKRALVVGCGLGADAEYVAGLGFDTVAFDFSDTAIKIARERHPRSDVSYCQADLRDPPEVWRGEFDLVVEIFTVQALPISLRPQVTANVASMVASGGTLFAVAAIRFETGQPVPGPPWPLTRSEIDAFAADGLAPVRIEVLTNPTAPTEHRWRAEFRRP